MALCVSRAVSPSHPNRRRTARQAGRAPGPANVSDYKEAAIETFVILWMPGPQWVEGAPVYDQPFIGEHAHHIGELMTEGGVVLSGLFTRTAGTLASLVGMSVVKAAGGASLLARLAKDLGIVREVLTVELHPFQIVFAAQDAHTSRPCHRVSVEFAQSTCRPVSCRSEGGGTSKDH